MTSTQYHLTADNLTTMATTYDVINGSGVTSSRAEWLTASGTVTSPVSDDVTTTSQPRHHHHHRELGAQLLRTQTLGK